MVQYGILGPLEVRLPDGTTVALTAAQRLVLSVLLFASQGVVSADRLIDELWRDHPPADPARALRSQVSRLRRLLGPAAPDLVASAGGYRLRVERSQLDATRFEEVTAAARRSGGEDAVELFDRALAVWRGPALAEFAGRSFAQPDVVRLEELRLVVREERADILLSLGRVDGAVMALEALVAERPERERARASLMEALYRQGRHTDAIATYQAWRRYLADELGLDPSPALQRLERDILRHSMQADPVPQGRSDPALGLPGNSFVGRETELDDLAERVGQSPARHADRLRRGRQDTAGLPHHRAGRRAVPRRRVHLRTGSVGRSRWSWRWPWRPRWASGNGRTAPCWNGCWSFSEASGLLLVVDNCEHLLAGVAALISAVLAHAPHVAVLATSRQRLGVGRGAALPGPPPARPDGG